MRVSIVKLLDSDEQVFTKHVREKLTLRRMCITSLDRSLARLLLDWRQQHNAVKTDTSNKWEVKTDLLWSIVVHIIFSEVFIIKSCYIIDRPIWPSSASGPMPLVNVKVFKLTNQMKEGGLYCSQRREASISGEVKLR